MRPIITTQDVPSAIVAYLTAALADRPEACAQDVTVSTKHSNPLPLPYVRVRRIGGRVNGVVDSARIDCLVWHHTEDYRLPLARLVHDLLLAIANDNVDGTLLYGAVDFLAPIPAPDPTDSNRQVAMLTVEVTARAQ